MRMERSPSLADLVTNRLRQEIVEGEFEFGSALSESKIAKRYDVSRTPVREAFARLELEELVRTEAQSGTYVFMMDREQFALISETRSVLECAALRLSSQRNPDQLKSRWQALLEKMETARADGNMKLYSALDGQFHDVLFDLSENPYLARARATFASRMDAVRNRLGLTEDHVEKSFAEHRQLTELVLSGEIQEASNVLHLHITKKGAGFWSVPEKTPEPKYTKLLGGV